MTASDEQAHTAGSAGRALCSCQRRRADDAYGDEGITAPAEAHDRSATNGIAPDSATQTIALAFA
jgi:hypothetical protein